MWSSECTASVDGSGCRKKPHPVAAVNRGGRSEVAQVRRNVSGTGYSPVSDPVIKRTPRWNVR